MTPPVAAHGIPSAEAFAVALIGAAVTDQLGALVEDGPATLNPRDWHTWRIMAATALCERGYEDGAVRRCLGLEEIRLPSSIDAIPKRANHRRAHGAWSALKRAGFYSLAGGKVFAA